LPYETGRTSSLYDSWLKFDQVIVSTQSIAIPAVQFSIPSWWTSASDNTWGDVPGSAAGSLNAIGAPSSAALIAPWTGFAYDTDNRRILTVATGGHADRAENDAYALPLTAASNAWSQLVAASGSSDASDSPNSTGQRGDGSRAADHNYNTPVYAAGKVWLPAIGAISGSTGNSSSAVWYWNPDAVGNGTLGYVYLGLADTGFDANYGGVRHVESGSAYDPIGRKIWYCMQNYVTTAKPLVSVMVDSPYTVTAYSAASLNGNGSTFHSLHVHPDKQLLILIGDNATYRMDLTSPGQFTSCTESGRPTLARGMGSVFSRASASQEGAVLVWPLAGGADFYKMTFPASASGTYAWSTVTNSGTAPTTLSGGEGIWKKCGLIPMGDGHSIVLITNSDTGAVKYLKLPRAGR
jgi:hypothetical protein